MKNLQVKLPRIVRIKKSDEVKFKKYANRCHMTVSIVKNSEEEGFSEIELSYNSGDFSSDYALGLIKGWSIIHEYE